MNPCLFVDSIKLAASKLPEKKERAGRASSAERQDSEGHYEDMEGHEQGEDYEDMQGEECDEVEYVNTDRGHGDGHFIHPERADPVGSHSQTGKQLDRKCLNVSIMASVLLVYLIGIWLGHFKHFASLFEQYPSEGILHSD